MPEEIMASNYFGTGDDITGDAATADMSAGTSQQTTTEAAETTAENGQAQPVAGADVNTADSGVKTSDAADESVTESVEPKEGEAVPYDRFKQINEQTKALQQKIDALKPVLDLLEARNIDPAKLPDIVKQEQQQADQARQAQQAESVKQTVLQELADSLAPQIVDQMTADGIDPYDPASAQMFQSRLESALSAPINQRYISDVTQARLVQAQTADAGRAGLVETITKEFAHATPSVVDGFVRSGAPVEVARLVAQQMHDHTEAAVKAAVGDVDARIEKARNEAKQAALAELKAAQAAQTEGTGNGAPATGHNYRETGSFASAWGLPT